MKKFIKKRLTKRENLLCIIGIGKYLSNDFPDIPNPISDCESFKNVLIEKYNFKLVFEPLYDEYATRENVVNKLNILNSYTTAEDNLVIYFAGHGEMHPVTNKGFWVPYDAKKQISDFIPNSTIKDVIEGIDAKHIFLCSDACFSGTFLTQTRSSYEEFHYSKLDNLRSRYALTSGGQEKVSDGGSGVNSPFNKYLVLVLSENSNKYLSVLEIINYVTKITGANSYQQPYGTHIENVGHEGGNMVFQLDDKFVLNDIGIASQNLNTESLSRSMNKIEFRGGKIATGKEILIVKSFVENVDYIIAENFRFNDENQI